MGRDEAPKMRPHISIVRIESVTAILTVATGLLIWRPGDGTLWNWTRWNLANPIMKNASYEEPQGDNWSSSTVDTPQWRQQRERMVDVQLRGRDVHDHRVLAAMERVPRHAFVPPEVRRSAYSDQALPLSHGQTISQPYIVGIMTQLVRPRADSKALDIGTGSGYQAAVLAEICHEVYSIEIVEELANEARERLRQLKYQNVEVRHGDGFRGWPKQAPFDLIVVAAAPREIPPPLIEQLAPGGRLVIPVGDRFQHLTVVEKSADGEVTQHRVLPVAFVPMTGEADAR